MKRLSNITLLFIALSLCSCVSLLTSKEERQRRRAERKIERITKKHPELLKDKEFIIDTTITVCAISDSSTIKKDTSASKDIDYILREHHIRDAERIEIDNEINKSISGRKIIKDTLIKYSDGVEVDVRDTGSGIKIDVKKQEQKIKIEKKVNVPVVEIHKTSNFRKIINTGMMIATIALILYVIYRVKTRKNDKGGY